MIGLLWEWTGRPMINRDMLILIWEKYITSPIYPYTSGDECVIDINTQIHITTNKYTTRRKRRGHQLNGGIIPVVIAAMKNNFERISK